MKYLTVEDYQSSIFSLNANDYNLEKFIALAEQDLEIITYNSITNTQIIKDILVQHTDFIIENYDYLYSITDNYSTLETNFQVGSKNCIHINGVFILKKLYVLLCQNGFVSSKC